MENIKFIKKVDYTRPWVGKDGKQRASVRYYLVATINGQDYWEAIKPAFEKAYNWSLVEKLAEVRTVREDNPTPSAIEK